MNNEKETNNIFYINNDTISKENFYDQRLNYFPSNMLKHQQVILTSEFSLGTSLALEASSKIDEQENIKLEGSR